MSKIGFEMAEEERGLKALDIILNVSIANFTEGYSNTVLTNEEHIELVDLMCKANGITTRALKRYEQEE